VLETQIIQVATGLANLAQTKPTDDHPGSLTVKETRFRDYMYF